jgi:hypothetical protein
MQLAEPPVLPAGAVPIAPVAVGGAVSTELKTFREDEEDPDAPRRLMLEMLPREMVNSVALPLPYHLAQSTGYGGVSVRSAESAAARARAYPCLPFYKPVSRCVGGTR